MSGSPIKYNPYEALSQSVQQAADVQSSAAIGAGDLIRDIANQNMDFLREQTKVARQDLQPFRQAGMSGMTELQNLLGLNESTHDQNIANRRASLTNQINDLDTMPVTRERTQELEGLRSQLAELEKAPPSAQQQSVNRILYGAETQAKLNFGQDAIQRTAAAQGNLNSGRVMEQLFKYGQDLASTQIGATQDRLLQLTNVGQQAAAGQAQLSQALGYGLGQQNMAGGEAQANAKLASANAQANALTSRGQIDFAAWQSGWGPGWEERQYGGGIKGIGGLLGALAGPLAGAGAAMGGLGGLGLMLGGAGSFVGSQNFM